MTVAEINIDNILKIIETIMAMIGSCQANSRSEAVNELRRPGWISKWRLQRRLDRDGVTHTDADLEYVYNLGASASLIELESIVNDAWGAF